MTVIHIDSRQWAVQEAAQVALNAGLVASAVARIRQLADEKHARYPQYAGYWNGPEWQLCLCMGRSRGKGGVSMEPGDFVLARVYPRSDLGGFTNAWEIYSVRRGWCCIVEGRKLRRVV